MEVLVFGFSGAKVLVFPTREGRFYDYENWGLVHALAPSIEAGVIQLICVDSVDSEGLYSQTIHPRARILRHKQYERYLLDEVVPFMRAAGPGNFLVAHGCSIGAYHAVNLALRYPGLFGKVVGLSGRYDLTRPLGPFRDLFDSYYDEDIYFHTPTHFMSQLTDENQLQAMRGMQIVLIVGEEDLFRESNECLSTLLANKGIPHSLEIWDGEAHKPRYWRCMVQRCL